MDWVGFCSPDKVFNNPPLYGDRQGKKCCPIRFASRVTANPHDRCRRKGLRCSDLENGANLVSTGVTGAHETTVTHQGGETTRSCGRQTPSRISRSVGPLVVKAAAENFSYRQKVRIGIGKCYKFSTIAEFGPRPLTESIADLTLDYPQGSSGNWLAISAHRVSNRSAALVSKSPLGERLEIAIRPSNSQTVRES
ncbi:hypothetical protein CA85_37360 [Allorhodopirellula solitaria]|uniref:Uncharacterized protein n=1 Tax=Allorhodopirellula solitaria TaxID=2527987 RepID=A0A5C5XQC1_9BACT|nr:hypothetical protein CA85_37360 [Allorhodopirellula solitaria]